MSVKNLMTQEVFGRLKAAMIAAHKEDDEAGFHAGKEWACEVADYAALASLQRNLEEYLAFELCQKNSKDNKRTYLVAEEVYLRAYPRNANPFDDSMDFWSTVTGEFLPSSAYILAFARGALAVLEEFQAQVQAEVHDSLKTAA